MNNKVIITIYLLTIESKKQTKQTRIETESWTQKHFDGFQMGGRRERMGEGVRLLRSTNMYLQ